MKCRIKQSKKTVPVEFRHLAQTLPADPYRSGHHHFVEVFRSGDPPHQPVLADRKAQLLESVGTIDLNSDGPFLGIVGPPLLVEPGRWVRRVLAVVSELAVFVDAGLGVGFDGFE